MTKMTNRMGQKAMIMPAKWERFFVCIIPYFHLLGKYAWLNSKHQELVMRHRFLKVQYWILVKGIFRMVKEFVKG